MFTEETTIHGLVGSGLGVTYASIFGMKEVSEKTGVPLSMDAL